MANVKLIYPSGHATPITYTCPNNPDFGHRIGRLATSDDQRTFDGTLNSLGGARKSSYDLNFTNVSKVMALYFLTLYDYHCPIDLYLNGVDKDNSVMMMEPPEIESQPFFDENGQELYSFSVRLEEI